MNIDEAVQHIGAGTVIRILNSGHAQDAGHPDSLRGCATAAAIRGDCLGSLAFSVLAAVRWEWDVRMACKTPEQLAEAFLDGSGRACGELVRRGIDLPQPAALQPAWL